jgi:DNA polymerase
MSAEPTLSRDEKQRLLQAIAEEAKQCQKCPLYKGTHRAVPGEGDPDAAVMLIGEAPGYHEDMQGRPFVGAAGQFLEELLRSVGFRRDQVFIANVVKHRPPQNRDPEADEIAACSGYLDRQIEIVDPKVIVTLGRFSMSRFFPGERISRIHGVARRVDDRLVLAQYHPAAALHQASLRRTIEDDFRQVTHALAQAEKLPPQAPPAAAPAPAAPPEPEPKQLSLF